MRLECSRKIRRYASRGFLPQLVPHIFFQILLLDSALLEPFPSTMIPAFHYCGGYDYARVHTILVNHFVPKSISSVKQAVLRDQLVFFCIASPAWRPKLVQDSYFSFAHRDSDFVGRPSFLANILPF